MTKSLLSMALCLCGLALFAQETAETSGFQNPDPEKWYRLTTRYNGTDSRVGRCIEYVPSEGILYGMPPADGNDYQYWRFLPSDSVAGQYTMICKGAEDGFLNPDPTTNFTDGRWRYVAEPDSAQKAGLMGKMLFITTPTMSGVDPETGNSYCAITSAELDYNPEGTRCMNCGGATQNYAINVYYETASQDANEWLFNFEEKVENETAVMSVEAPGRAPSGIYSLQGVRLLQARRGLNIVDGRLVLK